MFKIPAQTRESLIHTYNTICKNIYPKTKLPSLTIGRFKEFNSSKNNFVLFHTFIDFLEKEEIDYLEYDRLRNEHESFANDYKITVFFKDLGEVTYNFLDEDFVFTEIVKHALYINKKKII